MSELIERLIKPRLRVQDARAADLESRAGTFSSIDSAAVVELLIDRLTLLDACDELYGVIEQLRIERDDAYENASQKHQAAMAKLRGELAVAKDAARFGGSKAGKIGGPARAAALSPERRKEIAVNAAKKRWQKP